MNHQLQINKLLTEAGWFKGRKFLIGSTHSNDIAYLNALEILKEYGGLKVGETGAGLNCAKSDIQFYLSPSLEYDFSGWESKLGPLIQFASAGNEHMFLLVNPLKEIFVYTCPDGSLYKAGNFIDSITKLLLGFELGARVEKA